MYIFLAIISIGSIIAMIMAGGLRYILIGLAILIGVILLVHAFTEDITFLWLILGILFFGAVLVFYLECSFDKYAKEEEEKRRKRRGY